MATVFVGIGSNLDNPRAQVRSAFAKLDALDDCGVTARSSLYASAPMGPQDQPDYVNAVARMSCTLEPIELLAALQDIEKESGRVRGRHWGARILDLDILVYDDHSMENEQLTIPHPGILKRAFVLVPLAEIDSDLEIPGHGTVTELLLQLNMKAPLNDYPEKLEDD